MKKNQYLNVESMIYLIVLAVASAMLGLVLPFSILIIFDRVVPNAAETTLWFLYLIILVSIMLDIKIQSMEEKFTTRISKRYEQDMTAQVFRALCRANIMQFNKMSMGEYLERIRSIAALRSYFGGDAAQAIIKVISCVIIISIITIINPMAGFILAVASALLYVIADILSKEKVINLAQKLSLEGRTNSKIVDIVLHPLNVKSAAMERRMENFMAVAVKNREQSAIHSEKIESRFPLSLEYIQQISLVCVVVACAVSVIQQGMSQGGMAAIILLTNRYFSPYRHIMNMKGQWRVNMMQLDRLNEIIALEGKDIVTDAALNPQKICVEGERPYIFRRGNIYVINGGTASGKTHLMESIMLDKRDARIHITMNNEALNCLDYISWKNTCVRVHKESSFIEATIIDNLTCFQPKLYKAAYSLCHAMGVKEVIDRLPRGFYTELKSTKNYPFSRQVYFSLLIIRALLCEKSVLIIDDIDLVFDKKFEQNLIRCVGSRADSRICFFVSNKMTAADKNIISVPVDKILAKEAV